MNVRCIVLALIFCIMNKVAWGEKKYELPSLDEICRHTTNREVAGYLVGNNLIENKTENVCGKIYKYEKSNMSKPPCQGSLSMQGPFAHAPNKLFWRCWKCKQKKSIFHGTLLDKLNVPLPSLLQTLYLTMQQIPVRILWILVCFDSFS